MNFSFLPSSFKQSINNCTKISVRTSSLGDLPEWGQLQYILKNAFGVENIVSGLNHNLESEEFLNRSGNVTCFKVDKKVYRKKKKERRKKVT